MLSAAGQKKSTAAMATENSQSASMPSAAAKETTQPKKAGVQVRRQTAKAPDGQSGYLRAQSSAFEVDEDNDELNF